MEAESVVCNTITFKIELSPKADLLDQSYIDWTSFISTPNSSIMDENQTMLSYSSGKISLSFYLKADLEGKKVVFKANYSTLF